jgi:hypothetical protein
MKSEWFKRWDDEEESVDDYWAKTRDEDVKDEDDDSGWKKRKSKSSSWWDSFHGTSSKKSSYTPVKSTSAYLRSSSSYSGWSGGFSSRRTDRDDLLEVLKEVNKTINLTQNSTDGKNESSLVVRYSDGHAGNDLTSPTLFVSPNVIRDENGNIYSKDSDEYYNGLDALNGQAMLCSFMKKSVSEQANRQYVACDNWAVRNIYMTDLQTTAGNEICHDWPGFQSYIQQQQQVFQMSKEEVLAGFNDPNQNIDNFINLLCYNRLSTDRIKYSDVFQEDIAKRLEAADHYVNSQLDQPWHNDGRFMRANDIFTTVQRMLDLQEPPPPPPEPSEGDEDEENPSQGEQGQGQGQGDSDQDSDDKGEGQGDSDQDSDDKGEGQGEGDQDSDGEGDQESNGQGKGKMKVDNIDTQSNSKKDRRFTGDNSYNGQAIENEDSEGSDIDPNEKIRDRAKRLSDTLKNIDDRQLSNVTYNKLVPAVNDEERRDYKSFITRSRRAINAVKDCFRFHNTDAGLYSYGLTAGGIDENSMFKVYMGENDRLYERRDVVTRKKWLVSILIDQSGSMGDISQGSTRQDQANQIAIIFGEALKSLADLDFSIYGFSTNGNSIDTFVYKDKEESKMEALIAACPHSGTGIGFHVAHVGDKMISQYGDYENKILFVVTDGEPNCSPTPTMDGYQHTRHCCELLRKRGIHVYGIGVANAFGVTNGERLFGAGQFCVINDIAGTLNILVGKVRSFLQRMKK